MKKLLGILLFISIALSANAQLLWKVSGKGLEKPLLFRLFHLMQLMIKMRFTLAVRSEEHTSELQSR